MIGYACEIDPDYLAADARFKAAETTEEKLVALEEMYATIPKHKGTEKMRADIKKRISKLRDKEKSSKHSAHADVFHVDKQGAGQVVLLGGPNSGKSSILARLTSAEPEITDYPFATRYPVPGMMEYEDILVQLVDAPSVSGEHTEGGVISLARGADAVALVLDGSEDTLLNQIEDILAALSKSRTVLLGRYSKHRDYPPGTLAKPALVIANKMDSSGAAENLEALSEFYCDEFDIQPASALTGEGLEELRIALFEILGIIRVYTKLPGKPADMGRPFTLKKGSTLIDFAAVVHKDFAHTLRYARAWGRGTLDGAQVGRDHVLEDGDVVELHA